MRGISKSGWCLLALGACLSFGCQAEVEREPVYSVTGTVTQNGTPLAGAVVTFVPVEKGHHAATGTTDDSGQYHLSTWAKDDGAEAGQYQVTVSKYEGAGKEAESAATPSEPDSSNEVFEERYPEDYNEMDASQQPPSKNLLPDKYAQPQTSGFEARVTEDEEKNVFDFNLMK